MAVTPHIAALKGLTNSVVGLNEETGKSAAATVMLVNALNSTLAAQKTLAQSFVSTGREVNFFAGNVALVGMNLAQSAKEFADMNSAGIREGRQQMAAMAGLSTLLGKNTKAMFQVAAFNEHALGITGSQNATLMATSVQLGEGFNVDSDKLVNAMAKLGQTLISAAATYGSESSVAIQQATMQLTAEIGTGASELITKVMAKIAAGTAESGKLAAVMGVNTAALRGSDPAAIVNLVKDILARGETMVGGARGANQSEFIVPALMKSIGIDANFLLLADSIENGFKEATLSTPEEIRAEILQEDINTSIAEMQKGFMIVLLPVVKAISAVMHRLTDGIVGQILIPIFSGIAAVLGTMIIILTGVVAAIMFNALITSNLTPWTALMWGSLALIGVGVAVTAGIAMSTNENTAKIAEESQAQTTMMKADRSKSSNLLSTMNNSLLAMLVNQELQLNELETGNQITATPVDLNITGGQDPHGSLAPSTILGGIN